MTNVALKSLEQVAKASVYLGVMAKLSKSLQTDFATPQESPGFLLWKITNSWQRQIRAALHPYDLTHVQFTLLASLAWLTKDGHIVTQVELAHHIETDVMMTSQVVRTLEHKKLLKRTLNPLDKRAFHLLPTKAGLELANKTIKVVEAVDREFFGKVKRLEAFTQGLHQLQND
jgi:MarR family transcriptional regulator, organic hydroperoxide resistance regulator